MDTLPITYKILIVDDEEIEREGMAGLIDWEQYGMALVGTAWNGIEGFEKISALSPDIVLTDIKMPGMDGIELIRKTREEMPWVEFVVLSGYGEFEYTSKAMEQLFRDLIFGEPFKETDFRLFAAEHDLSHISIRLLSFLRETGFDYLEQFIIQNIVEEQLGGAYVLLSAYVKNQMIFLLDERAEKVEENVKMLRGELKKRNPVPVFAAVSERGRMENIGTLYGQVEELFRIGQAENRTEELLSYQLFSGLKASVDGVVDFQQIKEAESQIQLFEELCFTFLKMGRKGYLLKQKEETAKWIAKVLYGKTKDFSCEEMDEKEAEREIYGETASFLAECKNLFHTPNKEQERVTEMILATFRYFDYQPLNLRFLAGQVLYRNEEYLSRVFQKVMHCKYSAWLINERVGMAKRLLELEPEMKISTLAELVGYAPDGQYFSKIFHKTTGMTPAEYRNSLQ